jgi:hypothetical protein
MKPTVFMSLFAGGCVLLALILPVTETTPVALHRSTETNEDKYFRLRSAVDEWQLREIEIDEFVKDAYCPFQVIRFNDITRILCDTFQIMNCFFDDKYCNSILHNCYQAYMDIKDILPSAKEQSKDKVEVGCIYHPKPIGESIESPKPSDARVFY